MAVDSRDPHTQRSVFQYAARHHGVVLPCRGEYRMDRSRKNVFRRDEPGGFGLWNVNMDVYRMDVLANYRRSMRETGAWLIAADVSLEYAKHLESWQVVEKDDGSTKWKQVHKEDHWLDCEIYCSACRDWWMNDGTARPVPNNVAAAAMIGRSRQYKPISRKY